MKKKYKILAIIYFLLVAVILIKYKDIGNIATDIKNDLSYVKCGNMDNIPRPLPRITTVGFSLLTVGTPIILIIFSIITLIKANASGTADEILKARANLFKKFVIAAVIFFVGALVQFLLLRLTTNDEDTRTVTECMKCFLYYSTNYCQDSGSDYEDNGDRYKKNTSSNYVNSNIKKRSNRQRSGGGGTTNVYTGSSDVILVGDSRTVQICGYTDSAMHSGEQCRDYTSVAQGGKGATWFKNEAVPAVSIITNGNPTKKFNIVILMGANDAGENPGNETNAVNIYKNELPSLANGAWKGHNITFVKLPCGDQAMANSHGMHLSQSQIDSFNNQIKSFIESQNISNLRYCEIEDVPKNYLSDGVHYTKDGSEFYYNQIKTKCV